MSYYDRPTVTHTHVTHLHSASRGAVTFPSRLPAALSHFFLEAQKWLTWTLKEKIIILYYDQKRVMKNTHKIDNDRDQLYLSQWAIRTWEVTLVTKVI